MQACCLEIFYMTDADGSCLPLLSALGPEDAEIGSDFVL